GRGGRGAAGWGGGGWGGAVAWGGRLRPPGRGGGEPVGVAGGLVECDHLGEPAIGAVEVAGARVEDGENAQALGHDLAEVVGPAEPHGFFGALACERIVLNF